VKGKKYPKYVLTISPRFVDELGWQKGTELEVSVKGNKLVIIPKKEEEKSQA
jgi:antitoxin component of MazEF toxin-antitoxin module